MKYNGFYFWMFKSPMKKVLAEKYGREYAADIMKKSKKVYRELVEKADDIGDDNPRDGLLRQQVCALGAVGLR